MACSSNSNQEIVMSRKWNETAKPIRCKDCVCFDSEKNCCEEKGIEIPNPNSWRYCSLGEEIPFDQRKHGG